MSPERTCCKMRDVIGFSYWATIINDKWICFCKYLQVATIHFRFICRSVFINSGHDILLRISASKNMSHVSPWYGLMLQCAVIAYTDSQNGLLRNGAFGADSRYFMLLNSYTWILLTQRLKANLIHIKCLNDLTDTLHSCVLRWSMYNDNICTLCGISGRNPKVVVYQL